MDAAIMGARNNNYHYATVLEAIDQLRAKGYLMDFNLEENCISCQESRFSHEDFDIVEIYRYEGDTDPAEEATVFGIESATGIKGILVTGNSAELGSKDQAILRKLHY